MGEDFVGCGGERKKMQNQNAKRYATNEAIFLLILPSEIY